MLKVFAIYPFFYLSKGFPRTSGWRILQQIFYLAFFFISKESVASLSFVWFYLYSRVLTDTEYCTLQIIVRNAVSYTWYFDCLRLILLLIWLGFFTMSSLDHFEGCYSLPQSIFFKLFTVFMQVTIYNYFSRIFLTKSHFSYEFSPNSDRFRVFVLLSPILINLLMCPRREIKTLNFSR